MINKTTITILVIIILLVYALVQTEVNAMTQNQNHMFWGLGIGGGNEIITNDMQNLASERTPSNETDGNMINISPKLFASLILQNEYELSFVLEYSRFRSSDQANKPIPGFNRASFGILPGVLISCFSNESTSEYLIFLKLNVGMYYHYIDYLDYNVNLIGTKIQFSLSWLSNERSRIYSVFWGYEVSYGTENGYSFGTRGIYGGVELGL